MHFVAMLAMRLPVPVTYELSTTALSVIPAVVSGGLCLHVIDRDHTGVARLVAAGAAMGLGIGAMHYIGMAAMRGDVQMLYAVGPFIVSIVVAPLLATASLFVAWKSKQQLFTNRISKIAVAGSIMGLAVTAMHYSGMFAARFFPAQQAMAAAESVAAETTSLTMIVSISIIAIIGLAVSALQMDYRFAKLKNAAIIEADKFKHLLEAVPDGVIGINNHGEISFLNNEIEELFQYARNELVGKPIEVLMPNRFWESHIQQRDNYMKAPQRRMMGSGLELFGCRADGSEFPVEISLNHIENADGPLVICSIRDITDRAESRMALEQANQKLNDGLEALTKHSEELRQLTQFGELLHGCVSEQEAGEIIDSLVAQLLPETSGAVYLLNNSRNFLQLTSTWGRRSTDLARAFSPSDCWALRRGRIYAPQDVHSTIRCRHVTDHQEGYVCIPMLAQGDILGAMHVYIPSGDSTSARQLGEMIIESKRVLLIAVSEQIGLALANIRLRDELRNQSIRDPLTGLFNRRFMEESLDMEMLRASDGGYPLSLVAIDLDHFKQFNDSFGHEGGDLVLREVGALLRERLRSGELACRLGGEELLLIQPETAMADAASRAEELRLGIEELAVLFQGQPLGKITASFGVAEYPRHGARWDEIMRAADLALYKAKSAGRNRVVVADEIDVSEPASASTAKSEAGITNIRTG